MPTSDAICRVASDSEPMLEPLWDAPIVQQKPNLFLASIHDLVLEGIAHPLADYFPSVGGARAVDASFEGTFRDFILANESEIRARIRSRSTQTNEVGRCAVLDPCLARIAADRGATEIALLDFGCSAGLNLGVDAYAYDYGDFRRGVVDDGGAPTIGCELRSGSSFRALPSPRVVRRLGIDLAPIDVFDEVSVRWLRACLWPNDRERALRFDRAIGIARARAHAVVREADGVAAIERFLRDVPHGLLPVVFHSWVLFYFEPPDRERFGAAMEDLVLRYDAVWLSAEAESLRIGSREPPPRGATPGATAWIACEKNGSGVRDRLLARSHPHARWLEWVD